jgi:putative ABC transport system permease protein
MFVRIVRESLVRKRGRKLVAGLAVALGATVATATIAIAVGIGDKVNRELRSYGANIEALPRGRNLKVTAGGVEYQAAAASSYLNEQDLAKLKSIFWANNILAFSPFLTIPARIQNKNNERATSCDLVGAWFEKDVLMESGAAFHTGARQLSPWWKVDGRWPEAGECLIGTGLAEKAGLKPGDVISIQPRAAGAPVRAEISTVSGILTTGSVEDNEIITHLEAAQNLAGLTGKVDRVEVSALTNPEDSFARRDPSTLSPEEYERWSCTPYPHSVAHDVERVLEGSEARPVLRISQTEGTLLGKINLLLALVAVAALAAAVLGVASTMMTTVLERRSEIGLLKAIGASDSSVTGIFMAEAAILGLGGGMAGLVFGYGMAQLVAHTVFGSSIAMNPVVVPLVLAVSVAVAFAGSLIPMRTALKFDPSIVLRGQ